MYGFDVILCETGFIPIQRLTHNMCNLFHGENFEAFLCPVMYMYFIHYFGYCVFRNMSKVSGFPSYNDIDSCFN